MRVYGMILRILILCSVLVSIIVSVCPNGCSGHGSCVTSVCECFRDSESGESYNGFDCSLRGCAKGNPFSAVYSKLVSLLSGGGVYYSTNRELSETQERNMDEVVTPSPSMKLEDNLDGGDNFLWKVSGIEGITQNLPITGGIISCKFTDSADKSADKNVNVISYTSTYSYVLFDNAVTEIDKDATTDGDHDESVYKSVVCNDILTMRYDLTQINPTIIPTPAAQPRLLSNNITRQLDPSTSSFSWKGYGEILTDMGLLKAKTVEKTTTTTTTTIFENDNFVFACFKPEAEQELKIYNGFKAVREDNSKDVEFTITADVVPANGDYCICLMDGEGKEIPLDESEISENVRKESDGKYYIGKYTTAVKNAIVVGTVDNTNKVITITTPDNADDKLYFGANRQVYATVLENGIFKEIGVKMSSDTQTAKIVGSIILPYLRSYPISSLTKSPEQNIVKTNVNELYKAYYFAESLLNSLKKEGGILQCKHTAKSNLPSERMLQPDDVEVDVKGIIRDSKNKEIIYSYIEIKKDGNAITYTDGDTLECNSIKSIRNDFTTYHSLSSFTKPTNTKITWSGYGPIFQDLEFERDNEVNFTCFKSNDNSKVLTSYKAKLSYDGNDDVNVQFQPQNIADGTYICFMTSKFDKSEVKLEDSDIKDKIIYDPKNKNYQYGDYVLSETTSYKNEEDGSEVIILSTSSVITLDPDSTITIPDYDKISKDIGDRLDKDKKFTLKVMKKDNDAFTETTVECTISKVEDPPAGGSRRLLTSKTISFTSSSYTYVEGDIPFYVLYLTIPSHPSNTPTPEPIIEIKNIDINSNLYEIKYFKEDLIKDFPLIGGKLQCKMNKDGRVGIIDVKGVNVKDSRYFYKFDKPLNVGRRILSDAGYILEDIKDCKILSVRKDMSFYNVLEVIDKNYLSMIGYGEIFNSINGNIACYTPSTSSNKEMKIYENMKVIRTKNNNNYDLKLQFVNEKPSIGDICYILSDVSGSNKILLESSDLFEFVRKESDGKYYYGKSVINGGISEEIKNNDGSVGILISNTKIVINTTEDRFKDDNKDKIDFLDINKESSPSIIIPPNMIGIESQKMVVVGNTVELIFTLNGEKVGEGNAQILKISKDKLGRFSILLSNQIYLPETTLPRLRSLQGIPPDLLVTLNWKSEGSTHIAIECSGQGSCDKSTGQCKCYDGFSGVACQRLDCPNNCNGNGRCVALSELLSNVDLEKYVGFGNKHVGKYDEKETGKADNIKDVQFENQVFGCLCDKRHRGYDCSLIECPSGEDPEGSTNPGNDGEYRDCSGRGICNYKSGVCECFDGFSGEGCQRMVQVM